MNVATVAVVGRHLVATRAKHFDLELVDYVLASALLVMIVNDEDFHDVVMAT